MVCIKTVNPCRCTVVVVVVVVAAAVVVVVVVAAAVAGIERTKTLRDQ